MKRKSIKQFYSNFVSDLKISNPGKWYAMIKKIGGVDQMTNGEIQVECLSNYTNKECADKIAEHFASISNEYAPVDLTQLPSYLPAPPPPKVEEYEVYIRLCGLKKTKSTLPIDIPAQLRQECAIHLAAPLTIIINNCLTQSVYPELWKQEWVTPMLKIINFFGY